MSKWLNTEHVLTSSDSEWQGFYDALEKPCHKLEYCPYGQLVEEFPLQTVTKRSCKVFGHDCPVFYHAEPLAED
jgi:hypothetical protein